MFTSIPTGICECNVLYFRWLMLSGAVNAVNCLPFYITPIMQSVINNHDNIQ